MHRIRRWTGTYFRRAALWEVGCYILVPHHNRHSLCEPLEVQEIFLEQSECRKDTAEQSEVEASHLGAAWRAAQPARHDTEDIDMEGTENEPPHDQVPDAIQDNIFEQYLDRLKENDADLVDEPAFNGEADDNAEVVDADEDLEHFPPYLPNDNNDHAGLDENSMGAGRDLPRADILNNSYVRLVHTNGVHHLAMVTCTCQGPETLPLDLVACRLMPASFTRIRTVFSAQVLDFFRLCNLELKASAYQFYQLLRRLTEPMAPAEVVDLYNEFRRMSRLWRWMKKLKWAGYGHNGKGAMNVGSAELANYCPACPQPGVNLPDDWKNDPNR